jgi:RNA polymerase sigma factor (sigma-70 family)
MQQMTASPTASLLTVRAAGRPTDEDLVAAVRAGDDRAFERLYARYHRRIAAYVQGMVQDHAKSEDITQEVFVSALRRMRDTDRPITFKPWIYEIAKNACIDAFRRGRRATLVSLDIDGDGPDALEGRRLAGREPTPDVAVDRKLELETLTGAFGGLTEAHHQILVMRELEGLSYKQIGDKLGMTRASVESTLFRARRRLEEEYTELLSGERCRRIQGIIAERAGARLGVRDEKRMARHVSYCQPCRRAAAAAGVDVAVLSPRPVRSRIAGWLPLPVVLRRWVAGDGGVSTFGSAAHYAEPLAGTWAKAGAALATLALAGAGTSAITGAGPMQLGGEDRGAERTAQRDVVPASAHPVAAGQSSGGATPRTAGRVTAGGATKADATRRGGVGGGVSARPGSGGDAADSGGQPRAGLAAVPTGAGSLPGADPTSAVAGVTTGNTRPQQGLPKVDTAVKGVAGGATGVVTNTVTDAVNGATGTVNDAGSAVGNVTGADSASGGGSDGPVAGTLDTVKDTVGGVVGGGG